MLLAEMTALEWGGLITATCTGIGVIVTAIFTGWKWINMENNKTLLALEKVKAATAKQETNLIAKEAVAAGKEKDAIIATSRQENHDLRDQLQAALTMNAANSARFEQCEKRLEDCEEDRTRMWEALNAHGITRISPLRTPLKTDPE